ncbi:hypothetical protein KCU95_g117, partial [Aureobasidium melanogenum]
LANANLPTYHRIIWLAISVIALAHISSFLVLLLHCRPIKKVWIPTTEGRCFAAGSLLYGTSGATLACNLVAIILPIRKLCSLRLGRAKQVSIVGYNLLGLLTPVCSVIRICQINTMLENGDPTMFVVWGVAEICVGIITSSLPALSTLPRNFSIPTLGKGSRPSATPTHVNIGLAPLTPPRSPDRASDKINLIKPGEVCSKGRKGGHDLDDDAQSVATSNVSSSWDAARLEQDLFTKKVAKSYVSLVILSAFSMLSDNSYSVPAGRPFGRTRIHLGCLMLHGTFRQSDLTNMECWITGLSSVIAECSSDLQYRTLTAQSYKFRPLTAKPAGNTQSLHTGRSFRSRNPDRRIRHPAQEVPREMIFCDLDSSYLDALGLFALLRLLTRTFGITAVLLVPLLVPLNYVHDRSGSPVRGLDKFSCLNILESHTSRLWAHLAAAYWFTGLFCLISRHELGKFVDIRHRLKFNKTSRSFLVTDIPKNSEKAAIKSMFHKLYASKVKLYTTGQEKIAFVSSKPYLKAMTQIEKEVSRGQHDKDISDRTRQKIQRCFGRVRECLGKPYDEYDFSSLAILEVLETDPALLRDVAPQTIWPLHTYRVSENLDCINWMNARKSVIRRTLTNVTMTILSIALSCALAVPVTFSASLGQIEDLTRNISWLYWVRRIPPHALAYLQGAVPQLLVAGVVALVPTLLGYLSLWHCHVTHAQAELVVDLLELDVDFVAGFEPTITGNYFLSFLTLQGFSLFADMIAQWSYVLKKAFKRHVWSLTPRHVAAIASQDPFSMTSMYSVVALLGVIGRPGNFPNSRFCKLTSTGTVYSIITPLALIPSSLGLFGLLIAIKPALRRFKSSPTDTDGEIFLSVINQLFVGLYIMQLCLAGIFISVESKTAKFACKIQAILTLVLFLGTCCFQFILVRSTKRHLLTVFLPSNGGEEEAQGQTAQDQGKSVIGPSFLETSRSPETSLHICSITDTPQCHIVQKEASKSELDMGHRMRIGMIPHMPRNCENIEFCLQITLWMSKMTDCTRSTGLAHVIDDFKRLETANNSLKLEKIALGGVSDIDAPAELTVVHSAFEHLAQVQGLLFRVDRLVLKTTVTPKNMSQ